MSSGYSLLTDSRLHRLLPFAIFVFVSYYSSNH